MKTILLSLVFCIICAICNENIFAQSPNAFSYQAVVRNSSGTVIPNQNVSFRINILQGSSTGSPVYSEEHSATTNPFGLVNLEIGNGTNSSGNFSTIDWGNNTYYIKVELDINAGNNYTVMGTNQLLSVPYALYSPGNYKAGNGISISNDTIKNTSPNQLVTLTDGSGISITGTYPDFTITNTNPDQTITLNGIGATTVTGTYPNFTIHSTDSNTTYNAGTGINISGGTITNTTPDQSITLSGTGATTVTGTYPNFTINSTDNNTAYSAGTGININGSNQIINTAPDQTVVLTNGNGVSVTGTYPNFTITNTNPDQTITLSGTGATTVTGTYPNFAINSTDNNTTYSAGAGLSLTGSVFNAVFGTSAGIIAEGNHTHSDYTAGGINGNVQFNNNGILGGNTNLYWDNANSRLGIGISNPTTALHLNGTLRITDDSEGADKVLTSDALGNAIWVNPAIGSSTGNANYIPKFISSNSLGNSLLYQNGNYIGLGSSNPLGRFIIKGDSVSSDTVPLFEVKDKDGITVFVVWPTGVHVYVEDTSSAKSQSRGSFAVSGKSSSKSAGVNNYFKISPSNSPDTVRGARILWYPKKEAFYTGNVLIEHPDSVGANSMATGFKSKAKGNWSQALGFQTIARGNYSTAIGRNAVANNENSFAFGNSPQALGIASYAFGANATAQGDASFALGAGAIAQGEGSFAFGSAGIDTAAGIANTTFTAALGKYAFAIGQGSQSMQTGAFCLGTNNIASGQYSMAAGDFSQASGNHSFAANGGIALGDNSIAIGNPIFVSSVTKTNSYLGSATQASGPASIAIGHGAIAHGANSIAIGNTIHDGAAGVFNNTYAAGDFSIAIGTSVMAQSCRSFVIGQYNIFSGDTINWVNTDPLFVVGNGLNSLSRSNAMTVLKNGFTGFNRANVSYPIHVGNLPGNGNGAYLSAGGAWTNGSSKEFKDRFKELDKQDILLKIENMDLYGWYYKETNEYHIWPFAEDFYEAFATGDINNKDVAKYLSAADIAGVGLAAIQELIKENKKFKNKITDLENENIQLKLKIQEIDKLKAEIANIKLLIGTSSNK
ncbi:MAG: hypothetical protein HY958_04230 [Bacteroidia bacterium]|nr:hypothetical protein [Bacteroidia bacterium]